MSLNAEDVEAIAQALSTVAKPNPPVVQAVALKLPTFWLSRPALCFAQVEAQFATRQPLTIADLTKYNYVEAALDNVAAAEVDAIILAPPSTNKYQAIKDLLTKAFGKTQVQKDNELLSPYGHGDRKPSCFAETFAR